MMTGESCCGGAQTQDDVPERASGAHHHRATYRVLQHRAFARNQLPLHLRYEPKEGSQAAVTRPPRGQSVWALARPYFLSTKKLASLTAIEPWEARGS